MTAEQAAAPEEAPSRVPVLGTLWAFAHLAVLSAFALAQPLFDLLKDNPEFFAARGSTGFDIISFSLLLVLVPPALLLAVELLYRTLRDEGDEKILTLTMNLADPSPGLGWRGLERKAMPDRGKPDLVLALALIHHVAMSANVPVKEFVDWLAGLGCALVIEFPTREDPMVKKLLAPKRDGLHPDYELGFFERTLAEAFDIERSERLQSGTRVLYYARPKGG